MGASKVDHENEVLVRSGFKLFCNILAAIIVLPVTAAIWGATPTGEVGSLAFKVFFTYYLLAFLYSVYFLSYKYKFDEPNVFTLILRLLGGAGFLLFPFLLPFYFFSKLLSAISNRLITNPLYENGVNASTLKDGSEVKEELNPKEKP